MYMPKYERVDENGNLKIASPMFNFKDVTMFKSWQNNGECQSFQANMDYSTLLGGICTGAYRIVTNFRAYC